MIELPETYVLSEQVNQAITGKVIKNALANAHPHGFAWYTGDPAGYNAFLAGKKVTSSPAPGTGYTCGGVEIVCEDMLLVISTPIKYHEPGGKLPKSHQLLIEFEDSSHLSCTVQMWGMMCLYPMYENGRLKKRICDRCETCHKGEDPNPMSDAFDKEYFDGLWEKAKPSISAKAFLATEQRIPGLGNGVLQDILFNARIHPKHKLEALSEAKKELMFNSVKSTMTAMKAQGGRDTERDLYGNKGGYKTILSANTLKGPCPICGTALVREAYLGGNIYFCPFCQPL